LINWQAIDSSNQTSAKMQQDHFFSFFFFNVLINWQAIDSSNQTSAKMQQDHLNLYASRSILSGKQPVLAIWVPLQLTRTK
jgi:hypothetical protein